MDLHRLAHSGRVEPADIHATQSQPDVESAHVAYSAALALADEIQLRPLVARCRLARGLLLLRDERAGEAESDLTTARDLLRSMDMRFPPLAQERVRLRADGRVLVQLKTVWRDGTSHFLFDPIEFLEKLAAIIPRPAVNLLLYHGLLAPREAVTFY